MWYIIAAGAVVLLAALWLCMLLPARASKAVKLRYEGRSFAHRGLHANGSAAPENSLAAFRLAASRGFGSELDVQLTKDKRLVVFHDNDAKRVCGVDKLICELTFAELEALPLCGSGQRAPLFKDVLAVYENTNLPLIVELKSIPGHAALNEECCRATFELLRSYRGEWCVESFDPRMMGWFKKHAPTAIRGQLAEPAEGYSSTTSKLLAFFLSRLLCNFISRPHFIAYSLEGDRSVLKFQRAAGAFIVAWTCRSDSRHLELLCDGEGVIFEGYFPSCGV